MTVDEKTADLLEKVSDKIMETGLLTGYTEDRDLSVVSLSICGNKFRDRNFS